MGAVANRHQVVSAHVNGTGPYEVDVADDDVALAGDVEDARLAICLAAVAQVVDKQLAHLHLACFTHRCAIGQYASRAARCGQAVHIVVVHQLADVVAHVEFRTDACIVDTHNRAVRGTEVDVSRHHEVAFRAIEHYHGILRNGIVERIVVVSARGLQGDAVAFASARTLIVACRGQTLAGGPSHRGIHVILRQLGILCLYGVHTHRCHHDEQ